MFNVTLNREQMLRIIRGVSPTYEQMKHRLVCGTVDGSYGRWSWGEGMEGLTNEELLELFNLLIEDVW